MEVRIIINKNSPSLEEVKNFLREKKAGAIFIFNGAVRSVNDGKEVEKLEYEVDKETVENELKKFLKKYKKNVYKIFIYQAEGILPVGEDTIIIGVSSESRKEAFSACEEILEFMKHKLPVWKKEYYKNGKNHWL